MGRSTVNELIIRAKSMNAYNNSGIETVIAWVDFFNEALTSMTDDLDLEEVTQINYVPSQSEYDLPEDYYGLIAIYDEQGLRVQNRRSYAQTCEGWWVLEKGSRTVLDLNHTSNKTFKVLYTRYPTKLEVGMINTQKPDVPTVGESALCFLAINRALLNNNQFEQALIFDELYKKERAKIRTASSRARG